MHTKPSLTLTIRGINIGEDLECRILSKKNNFLVFFFFFFLIQGIVKCIKKKCIFLLSKFLQHFSYAVILNDIKPFNLLLICLHIIRLDLRFMLCLELLHVINLFKVFHDTYSFEC